VLKGVSLEIPAGGDRQHGRPVGIGESTLLHILGTLDLPGSGEVLPEGQAVDSPECRAKCLLSATGIWIPFFSFTTFCPNSARWKNVCIPGWIAGGNKSEVAEKNLAKNCSNCSMCLTGWKISRQRFQGATAAGGRVPRAHNQPDIVFADESTGKLDSANARGCICFFLISGNSLTQPFFIVTIMRAGRTERSGAPMQED